MGCSSNSHAQLYLAHVFFLHHLELLLDMPSQHRLALPNACSGKMHGSIVVRVFLPWHPAFSVDAISQHCCALPNAFHFSALCAVCKRALQHVGSKVDPLGSWHV